MYKRQGLERLQRGTIAVAGERVAAPGLHRHPEARDVGLVFQDFALFPHLDVARNVAFGLRGLSRAERAARVSELLELVGLEGYGGRYPHSLSGGEQQRIALARALAPRPQVLLLDEPFSGLDAAARHRVREDTRRILRRDGTTALLVTHDGEEALQLADRIALMRAGRLVQTGTGEELYARPRDAFAASLFGEVNRLEAVVAGGRVPTPFGPVPAGELREGERALVVFRHEALELGGGGEPGLPAVEARVEDSRFLGSQRLTAVTVAGADGAAVRLDVRHDAADRVEPGARVSLGLRPGRMHVFRAE